MVTFRDSIDFETQGETEIRDLTTELTEIIRRSGLRTGIACVFTSSSTSAITTLEYEPGLLHDLPQALERLFPRALEYEHQKTWQDGNGHSHVRAAFLGPSLSVPFDGGQPILGTWQQVVFLDFDNKPRRREVLVQLVGE